MIKVTKPVADAAKLGGVAAANTMQYRGNYTAVAMPFDELTQTGIYRASGITNVPMGMYYYGNLVVHEAQGQIIQEYHDGAHQVIHRFRDGRNIWTQWAEYFKLENIPANNDANKNTHTGVYRVTAGPEAVNYPNISSYYGILEVYNVLQSSNLLQRYTNIQGNVASRTYQTGAWGPWKIWQYTTA